MKPVGETAFDEGKMKVAKNAILPGLSDELIAELTNLPLDEIEKLRKT